mgnify:CR=1 FL=1
MEVTSGEIETPTLNAQGFNALLAAADFSDPTKPDDQTISEDNSLNFSSLDLDATGGDDDMIASVELTSGSGGLATDSGGDALAQRSATGDLNDINAFLDSLVYEPDYNNNGNPKPSIPELKDAIENARVAAEDFATETGSFTVDGTTYQKGAKGWAADGAAPLSSPTWARTG